MSWPIEKQPCPICFGEAHEERSKGLYESYGCEPGPECWVAELLWESYYSRCYRKYWECLVCGKDVTRKKSVIEAAKHIVSTHTWAEFSSALVLKELGKVKG